MLRIPNEEEVSFVLRILIIFLELGNCVVGQSHAQEEKFLAL
jgi:hypothetical protein